MHNGDCHFLLVLFMIKQVCACLPFVTCQADLDDAEGRFGKTVLHFMGMNGVSTKEKQEFWCFYKVFAHKKLNRKRNNYNNEVQKVFVGKKVVIAGFFQGIIDHQPDVRLTVVLLIA